MNNWFLLQDSLQIVREPDWIERQKFTEESLMKYTTLGRTGLRVSRLCLGTVNFGPYTSERDSHAIMDEAIDSGINFSRYRGTSMAKFPERVSLKTILGNWFALGGGRRERVILATKVYNPMNREGEADPKPGASPQRPQDHQELRGQPPTPQKPIPSISIKCITSTAAAHGRRIWQAMETARPAGQDHLRRIQQLRRMGYRHRLPGLRRDVDFLGLV